MASKSYDLIAIGTGMAAFEVVWPCRSAGRGVAVVLMAASVAPPVNVLTLSRYRNIANDTSPRERSLISCAILR